MLAKVIEILLNKYLQPQTSEQKAEKSVKEKIVFLHEALVHCHNSYLRYRSDGNEESFIVWRQSVGYLIRVLEEVRTTLASFAPDAFNSALDYAISEGPMPEEVEGEGDEESEELERVLERLKRVQIKKPQEVEPDIDEATSRLREFMTKNMTMGEVHKAQKAFEQEILP
jgi:hypothetical protein